MRRLRIRRTWWLGLGVCLLLASPAVSGPKPGEYDVKAAFLLNFARLVQWPGGTFEDRTSPLVLCVFLEDPFAGGLRSIVKGEKVDTHPLQVREVHSLSRARTCQILFVPASHSARLEDLRRSLAGMAVLVVGESEDFARRGGSINFYPQDGRIRFEINRHAAKSAGLRLSSRLLRLARLVEPDGG